MSDKLECGVVSVMNVDGLIVGEYMIREWREQIAKQAEALIDAGFKYGKLQETITQLREQNERLHETNRLLFSKNVELTEKLINGGGDCE